MPRPKLLRSSLVDLSVEVMRRARLPKELQLAFKRPGSSRRPRNDKMLAHRRILGRLDIVKVSDLLTTISEVIISKADELELLDAEGKPVNGNMQLDTLRKRGSAKTAAAREAAEIEETHDLVQSSLRQFEGDYDGVIFVRGAIRALIEVFDEMPLRKALKAESLL